MYVSQATAGQRRLSWAVTSAIILAGILAAPVAAAGPSVTVAPAGPLPSGTQTVTVTGSGFDAVGNEANGIYVAFGPVTPAPGYYLDPSVYAVVKWVYPAGVESAQTAAMAADGSFSTTLDLPSSFTSPTGPVDCASVPCAIITFGAHGSPDRSQDTCTVVTFVPSSPSASSGAAMSAAPGSLAPAASIAAPDGSAVPAASGSPSDACATIAASSAP